MHGGVLRGDAMGFEGGDDEPVGAVFDVGDEDLGVGQARGLSAGDGSRREGADLLDDRGTRRTGDRQDRGGHVLAQALGREGTDASEASSCASEPEAVRSSDSTRVTDPPPIDAHGVRLWRERAAGDANARATPKLESRSMRSKAWRTPNRLSGGSTGSGAVSFFFAEACST